MLAARSFARVSRAPSGDRLVVLPGARGGVDPLNRARPGALVTVAGVQGGAGASSFAVLLATAVAQRSEHPTLALESAGVSSGAMGAIAGAASQTSPEATAILLYGGVPLREPYATTAEGVHVIAGPPAAAPTTDTVSHALLERVLEAVHAGAGDDDLALLCRSAIEDLEIEQHCGDSNGPGADALARLLASSRPAHALVVLDLGCAGGDALRRYGRVADLHVWVVAARGDLSYVVGRLAAQPPVAAREAIVVWVPEGAPSASSGRLSRAGRQLSPLREMSAARGCSVVRMPTYRSTSDWTERVARCRGSLEALCGLLT